MFSLFRVKYHLRVNGLNQSRFLATLTSEGIVFFGVVKTSYNEMHLCIYGKDLKNILSKFASSCYTIKVLDRFGGIKNIENLLLRMGVLIGFLFTVFCTVYLSSFITDIEYHVEGDFEYCVSQCESVLSTLGISVGSKKTPLTSREIEKILQAKVEDISLVVVESFGGKIKISVKQAVKRRAEEGGNIVAKFSGKIESINLEGGVVRVDIGQFVGAGQTLIESGSVGDVYTEAQGSVTARVFVQCDAMGSCRVTKFVRSGITEVSNGITLGQVSIVKPKSSNFEFYESETIFIPITNFLIPMTKSVTTYFEMVESAVEITEAELIEDLKSKAYAKAKDELDGSEEIAVSYFIYSDGENFRVVCSIECIKNIAT